MYASLLKELVVIFALSSAVLLVCHRLRLPGIVGFLLTGILAGPHGLGLIKAVHEVEVLAEIGIVLLLFTIGLETSLGTLVREKKAMLLGGGLQVGLTAVAGLAFAWFGVRSLQQSILIGFLISLSSTALVLKLLQDKGEVDSPHGRIMLGILIFQDVIAIPMMLLVPILAGTPRIRSGSPVASPGVILGLALLMMAAARWLLPFVLRQVARSQNRELFLVSVVTVCFSVAWLTSSMGLSLALGAFLAGLIVSRSEYNYQAVSSVLPFRDIFSSFFIVSIGMLLDINVLLERTLLIAGLSLGTLTVKAGVAIFATLMLGYPLRTTILVGMGLSQVGEFSFVLARFGLDLGLLSDANYTVFLAVSVTTMLVTPLMVAAAPWLATASARWPIPMRLKTGLAYMPEDGPDHREDHLIIIGFGFNGQMLARAAAACQLPYVILETQPDIVCQARARGEPIYYGDASQGVVLAHMHVQDARVAVVAISDPAATRQVTGALRRLNEHIYIIVRTRYIRELEPLYALGADEVIPEEYETAVEIFTRVLNRYCVPREEIERLVAWHAGARPAANSRALLPVK